MGGVTELRPIARIETDFPEKFGIPRQAGIVEALEGRIVFEPEYRNPDALRGVLENDPRPRYQDDPARVYGLAFAGLNVKFRVENGTLTVISVE